MDYLNKVLKLAGEIVDPRNPKIHHVNVLHDDWCPIFNGGKCDCNPDIELAKPPAWFTAGNN